MKKTKKQTKGSKFYCSVYGEVLNERFFTNKITLKYLKSIRNLGKHTVIINNI